MFSPILFPLCQASSECHSLLKKHLSRAVLDELKTRKTSRFGSTLKDVVQSGELVICPLFP